MAEETEKTIAQKMQEYVDSEVGQNVKTILAYTIKNSSNTVDDEILSNSSDVATILATELASLENEDPTEKEMKKAAVEVLKWVASKTNPKWDDAAVKILDIFY